MEKRSFEDVVALMARLRAPDGCPWDRAQTFESLRTFLLEETYETLEAIDAKNYDALADELGDLLLQVVFHAQMAAEAGHFTIDDVLSRLHEKLVRRHPHVFGPDRVEQPDAALKRWEALKAEERSERGATRSDSLLAEIPKTLPALLEAYQMTRRAAQVEFDWDHIDDLFAKLEEEVHELRSALAKAREGAPPSEHVEDEVGDLLFVAVNIARFLKLDPEAALKKANRKFRQRFEAMEQALRAQGRSLEQATKDEMEELWQQSKRGEGK